METILRAYARTHALVGAPPGAVHTALAGFALGAILAVLYQEILRGLAWQWWDDPNYSHGFVVPLFSAFVVWQRRHALAVLERRPSWAGLAVVVVGLAMLGVGEIGAEFALMRVSLIVVAAGLVLFNVGAAALRVLAFPLAFLLLMIPPPAVLFYGVAFPLQRLAAENAAWALDVLGVPVLLEGNVITLSHIALGVTEACSGVRSLMSLLALAIAWAHAAAVGRWGMLVLAVAAVPITIVANAGRIVLTGLVGQWFGVEYASGLFHGFSGWLVFLLAVLGLAGIHGLLGLATTIARRGAASDSRPA